MEVWTILLGFYCGYYELMHAFIFSIIKHSAFKFTILHLTKSAVKEHFLMSLHKVIQIFLCVNIIPVMKPIPKYCKSLVIFKYISLFSYWQLSWHCYLVSWITQIMSKCQQLLINCLNNILYFDIKHWCFIYISLVSPCYIFLSITYNFVYMSV